MKKFFYTLAKVIATILLLSTLIFIYILPIWEPPRPEKEYKITLWSDISKEVEKELYDYINEKINKDGWANDDKLPWKYYMWSDLDANYFEDVYMDTEDNLLEKYNISYRFRYRRKSIDDIKNYLKNSIIPQRIEIQTKIYNKDFYDNKWYKTSLKNRYEIKNDYNLNFFTKEVLKRENLDLIINLTKNTFLKYKFTPVISLIDWMKNKVESFDYSQIKPTLYAILTRDRFHINKNTIFWYGDNWNNVFLITIDHVVAYKDESYKESIWKFSEIEVDFERNTLYLLFDAIDWKFTRHHYSKSQLEDIWNSFEQDQFKTRNLIIEFLNKKWIKVEEWTKTKHQKIFDIINKSK